MVQRFVLTETINGIGLVQTFVTDATLLNAAQEVLSDLRRRAERNEVTLETTFSTGFWTAAFTKERETVAMWEQSFPDVQAMVAGLDFSARCWMEQHEACGRYCLPFSPAHCTDLVATSAGTYEGLAIKGERYPRTRAMSGWYFFTELYNGDVKSLAIEHLYHVVQRRPDVIPFLALPTGHGFSSESKEIWFNPEIQ